MNENKRFVSGRHLTVKTDSIFTDNYFYANGQPVITGSRYTVGSTPPASPNVGDQWYDTGSNTLLEYINDGTSTYWWDIVGGGGGGGAGGGGAGTEGSSGTALVFTGNGTVDVYQNRLANIGQPVDQYDAVTKQYVDSTVSSITTTNMIADGDSAVTVSDAGMGPLGTVTISIDNGPISVFDANGQTVNSLWVTGNADSTSVQYGSLRTDGGLDVAKNITAYSISTDNYFYANGAPISFGGGGGGGGTVSFPTDQAMVTTNVTASTSTTTGALVVAGGAGIAGRLTIGGNILPETDAAQNIGSSTKRFKSVYLSGNTIDMNGSTISVDENGDLGLTPVMYA